MGGIAAVGGPGEAAGTGAEEAVRLRRRVSGAARTCAHRRELCRLQADGGVCRTVHVSSGRSGRFLSDRRPPVHMQLAAGRDYVWAKEVRSAP